MPGLLARVAPDLGPLRSSPAYRRLLGGQVVSLVGTQITQVAVPLQVWEATRSSLAVSLIGVAGLVPLVVFGLYGGAIADAVDRRRLVLVTSTVMLAVSAVLLVQAVLGSPHVWLLFVCVAVQAGAAAVDSPARSSMIPQLLPGTSLAAANNLRQAGFQSGMIAGPLLAGVIVGAGGYGWAYAADVVSFAAVFYSVLRLPSMPPGDGGRPAGLSSVLEGLRFLAGNKTLLMTFLVDINAMVFAAPRALFPALAYGTFHGDAATAGLLYAAPAVGAFAVTLVGGAVARVRRMGLGVIVSIAIWGLAVALLGATSWLWLGLSALLVAGAADTVSAIYRSTMLQLGTPPGMQGRLQGAHIVVVTGGPRLGDIRTGATAAWWGTGASLVSGGLVCLAGIIALALAVPSFARYDARKAEAARGG
ncbi:MFS transporter [Actinorhabdospora filicis]|uniref:MFS transporter n=1 Tax=Actinorhabdospora filicis TaxID=1785913 RepID=A0A9W6W9P4_9ACTN|nr:MFS transporter [Actinorhabdospora filicis]GLZ78859.1 MFS transporter [Actinorhabdospora filicis]